MSIEDMIKNIVMESDMYSQAVTLSVMFTIIANLTVALLMGLIIYYIYKRFFQGVVYSRSFSMTLVGMCVLTCMITLVISTNVVISLGMVGALSIVRYRTAVKDPSDLLYLFWTITTGITIGASMYILAIIETIIMICLIALFYARTLYMKSYIMILHSTGNCEKEIDECLKDIRYSIKSNVLRKENIEITILLSCKENDIAFVEEVCALSAVKDVTFVEYTGEYQG